MPPYLTPLQIFENYKKTNPQKCKGKSTTEICKLAGLSDKQIAELKTTSAWLFCFDKENASSSQDFSMTEIFGGNLEKKQQSKEPLQLNKLKSIIGIDEELSLDNIIHIKRELRRKYNKDIFKIIEKSEILTKQEKVDYTNELTQMLKTATGYKDKLSYKSQVKNEYYNGNNYTVKFSGNMVYIENLDKKIKKTLDLNKKLSPLKDSDKIEFIAMLQKLPGEVLMNLEDECNKIYYRGDDIELLKLIMDGYHYANSFTNNINLTNGYNKHDIVHELAHLIDYYWGVRCHSSDVDNTFKKEKAEYLQKTNQKDTIRYYLRNPREFFAETIACLLTNNKERLEQIKADAPGSFDKAIKCYKDYMHEKFTD